MKNCIDFTIPIAPRTKKNSEVISYKNGHFVKRPSKAFQRYQTAAAPYMTDILKLQLMTLEPPLNVQAVFYMDTRRRVDLVNLEQALCDLLVYYHMLDDDNCKIIASMDGSRVAYDKDNPRTEVTVKELKV